MKSNFTDMRWIVNSFLLLGLASASFFCYGCRKESSVNRLPEVKTVKVTDIKISSALAFGEVISAGFSGDTARGFCWAEHPDPSLSDEFIYIGGYSNAFSIKLTGLQSQTRYYLRAFASNVDGTSYGNILEFLTDEFIPPVVLTDSSIKILLNTANAQGTIMATDLPDDSQTGFCWSRFPDPTIQDEHCLIGKAAGTFSGQITGLNGQTKYYYRAYCSSKLGTFYGNTRFFTTIDTTLSDIDGNKYKVVQIGNQVWMAENLWTLHYRNGDPIEIVTSHDRWKTMHSGGVRVYYADPHYYYNPQYFYNGYATSESRNIAPEGWHIPSLAEFDTLVKVCGGPMNAGYLLKEAGTIHWISNMGATNASGFTAKPEGVILEAGIYDEINAYFWAVSPAGFMELFNSDGEVWLRQALSLYYGMSVRCVKDKPGGNL